MSPGHTPVQAMDCPKCAAALAPEAGASQTTCRYCGSLVVLHRSRPPTLVSMSNDLQAEYATQAKWVRRFILTLSIGMPVIVTSFLAWRTGMGDTRASRRPAASNSTNVSTRTDSDDATPPAPLTAATVPAKLTAIANCLDDRPLHSRERYLSWVDRKRGPTGKERHTYGLYAIDIDTTQRCLDQLGQLATTEPALSELDASSRAYAQHYAALLPRINEMSTYFESRAYDGDAWAKAKAEHDELLAALDRFADLRADLVRTLHAQSLPLLHQLIAERTDHGDDEGAAAASALLDAHRLISLANDSDPERPSTLDVGSFRTALDELTTRVQTLAGTSSSSSRPTRLLDALTKFAGTARGLLSRAESGKAWSSFERRHVGALTGISVDDSVPRLRHEYERVLSAQAEAIDHVLLVLPLP